MPTISSSHRDIIERSQIVTLATLGPGGEPQVTAMWFLWEDGTLRISLNTERQKSKNLMRDPRVSAFFVDPENPYRTIEIRGRAEICTGHRVRACRPRRSQVRRGPAPHGPGWRKPHRGHDCSRHDSHLWRVK